MFPNTKLALDVARNVSTIIKTFINIVAARHNTTIITVAARHEIIQSRHATTQQLYSRGTPRRNNCTDAKFWVSKRNPTLQKFP